MKKSQITIAVIKAAKVQLRIYKILLARQLARKDVLAKRLKSFNEFDSALGALCYVLIYSDTVTYEEYHVVSLYFEKIKEFIFEQYCNL